MQSGEGSRGWWWIAAALVLMIYWQGLHGPFLLDDYPNLKPIERWSLGEVDWRNVVFGNRSGALGRPVAMLSFMANVASTGLYAFPFKLTNLVLHLLCGLVLALLFKRLLARDARFAGVGERCAFWLALLWVLLPIQVSTVLYVVQRMTQLSALFSLLALLVFVEARERQERARAGGAALLFVAVPALTLLATLSKENGVLVPLLCGVLEVAYFVPAGSRRPAAVRAFFWLALALPLTLGAIAFAFKPALLLGGYANRDFTLGERLLTEPAALLSYLRVIVAPAGPRMGLVHDDFPIASALTQPWWTLPSILALLALALAAVLLRRRNPTFAAGVGLFLAGHALESTVPPLELYFEHRNYLPAAGVVLAVAGLARAAYLRLPQSSASFGKTLALLAFAIPAVYAMATLGRSGVWGSEQALLDQALLHSPDSRRLRIDLAVRALETAKPQEAAVHVDYLWRTGTPTNHAIAGIWRVILACDGGGEVAPALLDDLARTPPKYIHVNAMAAFELLANRAESGRCPSLEAGALAAAMQAWLSASRQDAGNESIWRTRFNLARVLTAAGRFEEARTEALRAWTDGGHEFGVGVVLFRLAATLNRLDECRALLAELERNVHAGDRVQRSLLEQLKAYLESNPPTPAGTTGTVDTET